MKARTVNTLPVQRPNIEHNAAKHWVLHRHSHGNGFVLPYFHGSVSNVGCKSVTEQIDTTTPSGKLIFHIFGALAEFERNLIRERTHAGLKAAKARGRLGGRPKAIMKIDPKTLALAKHLYEKNEASNEQLWTMLKISEATFYRIAKTWKHV